MGSRTQLKVLLDLEDCVSELKKQSSDGGIPINDDSPLLHRFQEKLEQILLSGLIEKPGLLGPKKSYWNYICACFASSKRNHDGISFVKSVAALKTSLGRGRAFVRFCLTQKCLADTLQSCFMEQKVSRIGASMSRIFIPNVTGYYGSDEETDEGPKLKLFELRNESAPIIILPKPTARSVGELETGTVYFGAEIVWENPKVSADSFYCPRPSFNRDFYSERSVPSQEKLWSTLVTSLYELNELNFDLSAAHTELDIAWPKFARKLFTSSENENVPSRNFGSSNSHTFSTAQSEYNTIKCDSDSCSSSDLCTYSSSSTVENLDPLKLTEMNEELSQQNVSLQKEVEHLESANSKLQSVIQSLQMECRSLQQQMNNKKTVACQVEIENNVGSTSSFETASEEILATESIVKENGVTGENSNKEETNLSVKPKIKSDSTESLESALPITENPSLKISNSCTCGHETQVNKNIYLPQNSIYITELLLEIKTVIDDIEDTVQKSDINLVEPHISHLKRIRNCLEEKFSSECDKSKSYLNFNNFIENCVSCIKNFTTKQENIIDSLQEKVDISIKGNQNLFSKIGMLKDLLRSYGFLKIGNEKEIEQKSILLPLDDASSSRSFDDFSCDIAYDPVLKRIIVPLLPVLKSSFAKLNSLSDKIIELQFGLDSSQELNNNLITRVQDQELHLKGVTKEIEEAQQLVSVLKKQHRKLQSAEGILKYDLQEKRKLLTRLKQQLENTREDFNLVRIKNSKSEAEWQDLRKEFVERHKQSSEESGFVDYKGCEERETIFSNAACDCNLSEESTSEKDTMNDSSSEVFQEACPKKSRLELLEEQCQSLYSNLLQSSKRRQDIDKRLETMCKTVEKHNEIMHSDSFAGDLPTANNCEKANDVIVQTSSEDICQSSSFIPDPFTSSPHSSSDVGSLNSECSSCIPSVCHDANSSDSYYCDSSKTDSCISCSPCKLQIGANQPLTTNELMNESSLLPDLDSASGCKGVDDMISSSESIEMTKNDNPHLEKISHVDSILIKKKDLEESLKAMDTEIVASEERRYLPPKEFAEQVSALKDEKRHLLNKVQELEKRTLIISTELDRTTQQLIISKAAKEHEVAALQFQLNTEALKYEKALKEFSEQSKGLEDMKQRVNDQERLILALEEALLEIRSERENEKEHQWQELEDIHVALETREQECISLCQELEKSMTEVAEEQSKNEHLLSQLDEIKAYNQKDRENMESEIILLKKYSRELQKKLVKLLKEKDILWKRSSHLYHIQKIKIDDRWMNDSEVSSCLGCKNNFSFMLRKHHCRLCGRIFCYSCSNNWLLTASSSKKLRACNECFVQHMEMKKVVRRGSDVPQIEDDTDDEANDYLSYMPTSRCSFNSEVPSSITDSVISLPITHKQSTPHFASAPDLRFAFKQSDEMSCCSITFAGRHSAVKEESIPASENDSKYSSQNLDISSDECTSATLENAIPKFKEILLDEVSSLQDGLSGDLLIPVEDKADLRINCQTCPKVLKWRLTSNYQEVPVTITYSDKPCDKEARICYQAINEMQDQMELSHPGYYIFHFDNTTRNAELEIHYNISAENQTTELENSALE